MIVANLCYHLGELLETMEKTRTAHGMRSEGKTLQQSINLYFKAISLYPYRGKYYYILAELTAYNYDYFGSMYWCVRAESCREPDNCKKQLDEIFEKAEKAELSTKEDRNSCRDNLVWNFILFFRDSLQQRPEAPIQDLLVALRRFLKQLQNEASETDLMMLSYVCQLSLYTVYSTVESINLKRSYYELCENQLYRRTIENGFHVIATVLEHEFNHCNHAGRLLELSNMLLPVLAYLSEFPSTLRVVSEIFRDFDTLLLSIYSKYEPHREKVRLQFKIFDKEQNLIGWRMLSHHYEKHRCFELERDNHAKITWVLSTIQQLEHIDMKKLQPRYSEVRVKPIESSPQKLKEKQLRKDKTMIVADGRNVAIKHGRDEFFSVKGLELVIKYWTSRDYPVLIILPDYCFDEEEVNRRRSQNVRLSL